MIIDKLKNIGFYGSVHQALPELINELNNPDILKADPGMYELSGRESFYMIQSYNSRSVSEGVWEAHRRFLDVQIVLSGREYIGYSNIDNLESESPYDEKSDTSLFKGNGVMFPLEEGSFMLLFPEDGHMPGIMFDKSEQIIKIVAKLSI